MERFASEKGECNKLQFVDIHTELVEMNLEFTSNCIQGVAKVPAHFRPKNSYEKFLRNLRFPEVLIDQPKFFKMCIRTRNLHGS